MFATTPPIPDVSLARIRSDFGFLFPTNKITVTLLKYDTPLAGNYGSIGEEYDAIESTIEINIQGNGTGQYSREEWGIDSTSKSWHCYVKYDVDVANDDRVIWNGTRFIVKNANKSTKDGNIAFIEFDLVGIDKDTEAAK